MYYIHTNSLHYGISIDIKHVNVPWADTIQANNKFESHNKS